MAFLYIIVRKSNRMAHPDFDLCIYITNELKFRDFDYIGNSKKDLPIWYHTKNIIHTNVNNNLLKIIMTSSLPKTHIESNFIYI